MASEENGSGSRETLAPRMGSPALFTTSPRMDAPFSSTKFNSPLAERFVAFIAAATYPRASAATTLPDSAELIRWDVTDSGFAMHLSGEVPARIAAGLADPDFAAAATGGRAPADIDSWAVHAGGRSILDAVEHSLGLPPAALAASRGVLADNGNMSSATLMFVLARLLAGPPIADGVALAFGPGLAAEGFGFRGAA